MKARKGPRQQGLRAAEEELQAHRKPTVRDRVIAENHATANDQSKGQWTLTWYGETPGEWISGEALAAATDGTVIDHLAAGVKAARPRARVNAFLIYAGSVLRALRAHHALGSTAWRTSQVVGQA